MDYQAATRELIVELEEAQSKLLKYQEKEIKELKDKLDQIDQKEQVDELYEKTIPYMNLNKRIEKLKQYFKDILNVTRQSSSLKMTVVSITDICIIALRKEEGGDTSVSNST